MTQEKFDPNKMQEIVDRLQAEGRLPSEEAFVEAAERIRAKYRGKVIEAITRKGKDRRRPKE